MQLATIVDILKAKLPGVKIIIAATIAPNSTVFGDGAAGLSFSPQDKIERTTVIKQYLDSTVKFARSQQLPLADAYHPSLDANGNGKLTYINGGDHIHYSDAGRTFFAQKIADAIVANHLLE
jgi:lysophospholipase L1-like esterase